MSDNSGSDRRIDGTLLGDRRVRCRLLGRRKLRRGRLLGRRRFDRVVGKLRVGSGHLPHEGRLDRRARCCRLDRTRLLRRRLGRIRMARRLVRRGRLVVRLARELVLALLRVRKVAHRLCDAGL